MIRDSLLTQISLMTLTLLPIIVSPGASFTLTLQCAVAGDRRGPLQIAIGTGLGLLTLALLLSLTGLMPMLVMNSVLLRAVSTVGGCLLIGLGVQTLLKLRKPAKSPRRRHLDLPQLGRLVAVSYLTVISNPKALLVYLLIAPKTMAKVGLPGYLTFSAVHITLLCIWLLTLSLLGQRYGLWFQNVTLVQVLLGLTGLYLMVLGTLTIIG